MQDIESLGQNAIFLLIFSVLLMFGVFSFMLWFGWWVSIKKGSPCPYTGKPMKLGVDIAASVQQYVEAFMLSHEQPENKPFDFRFAAISEETGRIFPDCVKKAEIVSLDWSFIQKRHRGKFVSWGSLSEIEQGHIKLLHESLVGFQTEKSCLNPVPKDVTAEFSLLKPGPLYVDRETKVLLGWKEVHGTEFEVLIVQKPTYESIDETL
jgi:hypothetical protein